MRGEELISRGKTETCAVNAQHARRMFMMRGRTFMMRGKLEICAVNAQDARGTAHLARPNRSDARGKAYKVKLLVIY